MMDFDLDRSLREKHRTTERLQKQVLKASSFRTNVSLGTTRRVSWRVSSVISARPKAKARGQKGSLRVFTVLDPSPGTPSRLSKFSFDRKAGEASSSVFQVTEANRSGPLRQELKYLAVSYCWPRGAEKQRLVDSGEYYWVRDARYPGKVRRTRAPKSIIDRAIAFAKDRDFRMIWIDQECIDQSDRHDKEHGIRSMDNVFHDAKKVVAFLQTAVIKEPIEVEALRRLSHHDTLDPDLYRAAIDTVQRISEDPWFTRAWTLQEATSGGNTLDLSMKCNPTLKRRDTEEWGSVEDEIQFDWAHITKWIAGLYVQATIYERTPPPGLTSDELDELLKRIDTIRMSLWNHFPLVHEPVKMSRPRLCCNASTALAFLKDRKNSRPTDRVSILANLGHYSVKLNTTKIGSLDMSACILAQALLNGDLSLLSGIGEEEWAVKREGNGFSWLPPLHTVLQDVAQSHEGYPTLRVSDLSLSAEGLSLPGYCWRVGQPIDVRSIREKFSTQWIESKRSEEAPTVISLLKKIQELPRREPLKSYREALLDKAEDYCGRNLQPSEDEHGATHQHIVGSEILWELLCYLVQIGNLKLANSIWHSVRTKFPARTSKEMQEAMQRGSPIGIAEELPATLSECIIQERDRPNLRVPVLSDKTQVSRLFIPIEENWEWLIERIMGDGKLWSGISAANHSAVNVESASCVFNVSSSCVILTPHCAGMEDMEDFGRLRATSLPQMRSKRISWIIVDPPKSNVAHCRKRKKQGLRRTLTKRMSWVSKMDSVGTDPPHLATKGLVAGMWMLGDIKPTKFTLI